MKEAVIVSTARTPIGKAYRGALNNTEGPTMAAHAIGTAIERAGIERGEVQDVILGCALQQGTTGYNVGRTSLLAAGMPVHVPGMTVDRQCSSGMIAIGAGAKQILHDGMDVVVAGGLESVSLVQNEHQNTHRAQDPTVLSHAEHAYMSMIETAETVSKRYGIDREVMDQFAVQSQARTAAAQQAGRYDDEVVPISANKMLVNKETGEVGYEDVTLERDEGNRPGTTYADLERIKPVFEDGVIAAGNASQLSRWRVGQRADGRQARREERPRAARRLPRHRGCRLRAGRDGGSVRCSRCRSCSRPIASGWTTLACGS